MKIENILVCGNDGRLPALKAELERKGVTFDEAAKAQALLYAPDLNAFGDEGILQAASFDEAKAAYESIAVGFMKAVNENLPRLSSKARICILSDADGTINGMEQTNGFAKRAALAALHMLAHILYNRMRPEGYTFRLFGGEDMRYAAEFFMRDRPTQINDASRPDEDRLVMYGDKFVEIPY